MTALQLQVGLWLLAGVFGLGVSLTLLAFADVLRPDRDAESGRGGRARHDRVELFPRGRHGAGGLR